MDVRGDGSFPGKATGITGVWATTRPAAQLIQDAGLA